MNRFGSNEQRVLLNLLKEARIAAGLRQSDLAERLNVPQSMVSKYELGERRVDVLEVREICRVLGISFTSFAQELDQQLKNVT